jgi:hypothetical protein
MWRDFTVFICPEFKGYAINLLNSNALLDLPFKFETTPSGLLRFAINSYTPMSGTTMIPKMLKGRANALVRER